MTDLVVTVASEIDGESTLSTTTTVPIPDAYGPEDIEAFTVRTVEDTAFDHVRHYFGRRPTRAALIAATARLRAIEAAMTNAPPPIRDRVTDILAQSNDDITAEWGEDPD